MLGYLLLLFVIVPLAELYLLLEFAKWTSPLATFALVITTGVIGASLARWQGWRTIQRIQSELSEHQMPTESLFDAAMILVAGALLLTPGIMTDAIGFSLLVPVCRRFYQRLIRKYVQLRFRVTTFPSTTASPHGPAREVAHDDEEDVIDSYVVRSSSEEVDKLGK